MGRVAVAVDVAWGGVVVAARSAMAVVVVAAAESVVAAAVVGVAAGGVGVGCAMTVGDIAALSAGAAEGGRRVAGGPTRRARARAARLGEKAGVRGRGVEVCGDTLTESKDTDATAWG